MNTVIFDLDGTITDPAEGITRSINYALVNLGYGAYPEEKLLRYIGPNLDTTFSELAGIQTKEMLLKAVALYRQRYTAVGYRENILYDGIVQVLSGLIAGGSLLCIATTKRKDIASKVLEFLRIDEYFTRVLGCDLYRSKSDLLRDILSDADLGGRPVVMIGDRDSDFLAASEVNIPSIAVRWGYGEEKEFALATDVVDKPADLPEAILKHAQPVSGVSKRR
jgi:phosphoglycolate phosphatase